MVSRITGIFKRKDHNMDCEQVRSMSSAYIGGELARNMAEGMKLHLDWCPPCNAFVSTLRATVDMLRATPKRKAPDSFRQRLREALRKAPRQ
jgi:predicted anti-sigma-YlaC factor YlaD